MNTTKWESNRIEPKDQQVCLIVIHSLKPFVCLAYYNENRGGDQGFFDFSKIVLDKFEHKRIFIEDILAWQPVPEFTVKDEVEVSLKRSVFYNATITGIVKNNSKDYLKDMYGDIVRM